MKVSKREDRLVAMEHLGGSLAAHNTAERASRI
jgi:hypothetical protein